MFVLTSHIQLWPVCFIQYNFFKLTDLLIHLSSCVGQLVLVLKMKKIKITSYNAFEAVVVKI